LEDKPEELLDRFFVSVLFVEMPASHQIQFQAMQMLNAVEQ
jgi:hypothetical protein